ncbi:M3 family metallopeptidase [Thiomicrospira sp. ALE5]|uniref:M3 family metallopeptidase n=1 Tax=Thiomicrospira sp. ALE5 TaxID=748650 RepID=UPI0008E0B40F|nr:M3 family metallopeptidase [Thiomicrospira sp. ALE5]SFR56473.1 oligopeptidase A [Thiomicrospira sp. ALE5]
MKNCAVADSLPSFSALDITVIETDINKLIADSRLQLAKIVSESEPATWKNLVQPIEVIYRRFEQRWGPVGHLDSVCYSDEWHEVYERCLAAVTQFFTEWGQNAGIFSRFESLAASPEYATLSIAQQKVIDNALRDFRLSGINLPQAAQQEYMDISSRLSKLSSQFGSHVLKATQAWSMHITDPSQLAGLPESAMNLLAQYAQQKALTGWRVTLDFPSYHAVMTYADNRALRETLYHAYATRASDQSDFPEFDNANLIDEIRALRHQKAQLLGFNSYADYSLATKMVSTPKQVLTFLRDLATKAKPQAAQELDELQLFAKANLGISQLEPWDMSYASEKFKEQRLSLSQEILKSYFEVEHTLQGMFNLVTRLFNIKIEPVEGVDVWHSDVRFYIIRNEDGQEIAGFYLDLYARENKRGGAWMDVVSSRWRKSSTDLVLPVAYLVCNFSPPVEGQQACLTHNEVTTLFHEFGHGLHHMLTEIDAMNVSGISGVPWDAVELPSQFMENFCWERESLDLFAKHHETDERLPDDLLEALQASRHFQSAMMLLRQVEFSLFDFILHLEYTPESPEDVVTLMERVRDEVAVVLPPKYHRFAHSFNHIFAGGYAAGYFSYKWAEVLSADAFSLFEETGVLNSETGQRFKATILAAGGSVDPMQLFKNFRGRLPQIDALLRHSGIKAA